jgi:ABC-type transport system substrate-binding protein
VNPWNHLQPNEHAAPASALRIAAGILAIMVLAAGFWSSSDLSAQDTGKKPAKEEVEDKEPPKKKIKLEVEEKDPVIKKRVTVTPEDDSPAKGQERTPAIQDVDLAAAAKKETHRDVKALYEALAVPHDTLNLSFESSGGRTEFVEPIPQYIGPKPSFPGTLRVQTLDLDWKPAKSFEYDSKRIAGVVHYEEQAIKDVSAFLAKDFDKRRELSDNYISRPDMLKIATGILGSALRFHERAREEGRRKGPGWEEVETNLRKKLLDTQLAWLTTQVEANDWTSAFAFAQQLARAYTKPEVQADIAKPLSKLIEKAIQAGNTEEARLRLKLMENLLGSTNAARPALDGLRGSAQKHFEEALALGDPRTLSKANREKALSLVQLAEKEWPQLPGAQDLRLKLIDAYPVLRVGVHQLPRKGNLSPATAVTDAEHWAVELMFESLVTVSYDPDRGQLCAPQLAVGLPRMIPLGRQFQLPRNAFWSNGQPLTGADVTNTVDLLRSKEWPGRDFAWADELLDDAQVGGDPYRVSMTFRQGFFDPLSLATFKILPQEAKPGLGRIVNVNDVTLATEPVGSGPFIFSRFEKENGRDGAVFEANPHYGGRTGKFGLPHIREIRMVVLDNPGDQLKESSTRVDIALDLATDKPIRDSVKTAVVQKLPSRRIYFLAVNHHSARLRNQRLRQALARAIDREAILTACFRGGDLKTAHQALNGPYPPGSWAANPDAPAILYKPAAAVAEIAEAKKAGNIETLTLKYPQGDPRIDKAMKLLAEQVKKIGVTLELTPLEAHALHKDVVLTNDYDLAYMHYDYPSEAYWLYPLLDPRGAIPGGRNYLGYEGDGDLDQLFRRAMSYRDPAEVRKLTYLIHEMLLQKMPFIPLWQLDVLVVRQEDVRTVPFDPLLVFTDVEQWKLEKK